MQNTTSKKTTDSVADDKNLSFQIKIFWKLESITMIDSSGIQKWAWHFWNT